MAQQGGATQRRYVAEVVATAAAQATMRLDLKVKMGRKSIRLTVSRAAHLSQHLSNEHLLPDLNAVLTVIERRQMAIQRVNVPVWVVDYDRVSEAVVVAIVGLHPDDGAASCGTYLGIGSHGREIHADVVLRIYRGAE